MFNKRLLTWIWENPYSLFCGVIVSYKTLTTFSSNLISKPVFRTAVFTAKCTYYHNFSCDFLFWAVTLEVNSFDLAGMFPKQGLSIKRYTNYSQYQEHVWWWSKSQSISLVDIKFINKSYQVISELDYW